MNIHITSPHTKSEDAHLVKIMYIRNFSVIFLAAHTPHPAGTTLILYIKS